MTCLLHFSYLHAVCLDRADFSLSCVITCRIRAAGPYKARDVLHMVRVAADAEQTSPGDAADKLLMWETSQITERKKHGQVKSQRNARAVRRITLGVILRVSS